MDAHTNLQGRVTESITFSRKHAIVYNVIYRVARGSIIVLSAITAAASKSGSFGANHLQNATPVLAITVAIIASLEAWLKPGKIYREHFRFNDLYIGMESRLALIPKADLTNLSKFADALDSLDKQYRSAIED